MILIGGNMDTSVMEKVIMDIYNNPTLQQMRKMQEQIDILNNIANPNKEYATSLDSVIKMAITPSELRVFQEWITQNKNIFDDISYTTGMEKALITYVNKSSFGVSTIQIPNSTSEHLLINSYSEIINEEEKEEIKEVNNKIVSEIIKPKKDIVLSDNDISQIIVTPINDEVLKFLSDNPEELYKLTGAQFEDVMAEIYKRLGYDVTLTPRTRDGGKDIIIKKPEIIGDFVYLVECKKHSPKRPVGVGIVRGVAGAINLDKVNGGIIATTSYFTRDARKLILDSNMQYQIQMHDNNKVQSLLKKVIHR